MRRIAACFCALLMLWCGAALAEPKHTVWHGDETSPKVAITMDDCYNSEDVAAALELCREYDIRMTFFVIGNALKDEDREMWNEIVAFGCEIGNHTYYHRSLTAMRPSVMIGEFDETQKRFDEVLGCHYPMRIIRPPYGQVMRENANVVTPAAMKAGYDYVILWNVSQTDPVKAIKAVRNGCIMLYHARPKDVSCLREIIPQMLEKGFVPVTVSELLNEETPTTWTDLSSGRE